MIAERPLSGHVAIAAQRIVIDRDRRPGDPLQQVDQRPPQRIEHLGELRGAHPRLERVQ